MIYSKNAFAKLTLTLRILDIREDGYNNLDALTLYCEDLFDVLKIETGVAGEEPLLTLSLDSTVDKDLNVDSSNLILKAHEIYVNKLREFKNEEYGFIYEIEKHIPSAAGLGGGSADCATTLRLLNQFYSNFFDIKEIVEMAAALGSDIPGCVYSRALTMTGRGDLVNLIDNFKVDLKFLDEYKALIITPDISCSTPEIYRHFDEIGRPTHIGIESPSKFGVLTDNFHNDLEIAAIDRYSELADFKNHIDTITGEKFMLAGSGSTIFAVLDEGKAESTMSKLNIELENDLKHEKIRQLCASALC